MIGEVHMYDWGGEGYTCMIGEGYTCMIGRGGIHMYDWGGIYNC